MSIEVIPRFKIEGKYYMMDDLPREQVKKIIEEKLDLAMAGIQYQRQKTA